MVDTCTIKLKMKDGSSRSLVNVRYVVELKINLISLGILEVTSMRVIMANEVLKLIK